jgi:hypothetical protein
MANSINLVELNKTLDSAKEDKNLLKKQMVVEGEWSFIESKLMIYIIKIINVLHIYYSKW